MRETDRDRKCAIVWKLSRSHGWSREQDVNALVDAANVHDKPRGRELARNELPQRSFIGYHPGKDVIWLDIPPAQSVVDFLVNSCGYSRIQVEATFDSYLD